MLAIQNLHIEFGARVIFKDLSFTVHAKERIAFAGHNGAGKSTLMKCIAGILKPNGGRLTKPKHCQIGYLPQEGIHIHGITLWDEVESAFAETQSLQKEIDEMAARLHDLDPRSAPYSDLLNQIGELELKLHDSDPGMIKPRMESVLTGLGFKRSDFTRDCGEFSGGWQMRIALAKLLLQQPEVLLLDEPTNHLDIDSQKWMESYLVNYPGAILIISHDLALLDMLTTRTIAFHHGRAEEYAGNYSFYVKESVLRKEILVKQYKSQQREIKQTQDFIDRFRSKATKAKQVQSRIKQLEKMEIIELEEEDAVMSFKFPNPPASGHSVAMLEKACKAYGKINIFQNFNFEITRGERLAIVGPNGAGKSTFCRLITGQEEPDSGTHTFGHKAAVSFFSQNHADELDPELTVLDCAEAAASRENAPLARNLLGCFLFRGDDVFKKIGVLSGGERSRVALVCMLLRPANFLILDEPTNHLDIQSQEVLQNALKDYPGSYMIVSHNRSFLDPIVTKTLEFRQGHPPRTFAGNITYYLEKIEQEKNEAKGIVASSPVASNAPVVNRKEQRKIEAEQRKKRNDVLKPLQKELEELEKNIAEYEAAQAALTSHMSAPETAGDADKMQQASSAYQALSEKLENTFSRWGDVSDQIEQLEAELNS
ncbi:ABC-F family ATP-binding cassette domain-containing protein [Verrucomicrobiaceae bacterium 5K15]|uniref:ABC-F family ATP-binding cassette domain-containing protein n=1 Tax=Oceaniferula flava TaxID=2800421 RepID=A0AAE2VB99_9BACT|nr:ABC-F family ATP-binding cassette domain-containing protein [Oceaniferula flavus]MBK1853496.1 ABC-F family ATP-binding cassette domain-containing protein [Oceaniferula flavus]MBM1134801.1 ABC-F family ATP-binding cassette domain-containing protein [Oceaniferula flavus]